MFSPRTLLWFILLTGTYGLLWRFASVGVTIFFFFIPAALLEIAGMPTFVGDEIIHTPTTLGWIITGTFATMVFWFAAWGLSRLTKSSSGTR